MSKVGMIVTAYRRIKSLPDKKNEVLHKISNKFEMGLSLFIDRTLKKSFDAFKLKLEEGRVLRKWAVYHFLNTRKGKNK
jgi:hypothetical protein